MAFDPLPALLRQINIDYAAALLVMPHPPARDRLASDQNKLRLLTLTILNFCCLARYGLAACEATGSRRRDGASPSRAQRDFEQVAEDRVAQQQIRSPAHDERLARIGRQPLDFAGIAPRQRAAFGAQSVQRSRGTGED